MAVTIQAGPGRSAFEEWKRHKGLPDATLDDFFNDLSGQDGDVPPGRRVDTGGLATGGGTLAANITIDVPVANAIEAKAGAEGAKALTPAAVSDVLWGDQEDQNVTGGFVPTTRPLGTVATGAITPHPKDGPYQKLINGGGPFDIVAAQLAAGKSGSLRLTIVNSATAGQVNFVGFDVVDGVPLTTTNGQSFWVFIELEDDAKTATVKARQ